MTRESVLIKKITEGLKQGELELIKNDGRRLWPDRRAVIKMVRLANAVMLPRYYRVKGREPISSTALLNTLMSITDREIAIALGKSRGNRESRRLARDIVGELPKIKKKLIKDVAAIYKGDPAANSQGEIILTYPGFYAISIYRFAHEFYIRNIPCIPRVMSEFAHEKTGIDIHPGAKIGEYFCIDHGTGIVIGETTVIGSNVKLYQGVTLGAKSIVKDAYGRVKRGGKRHPEIGDRCTVYANATILGGDTKIGEDSIIGGNVWLTHSVPAGSKIYYHPSES